MVGVNSGSLYRRSRSSSRLAWSEGRRLLGAVLHSSNELGDLSQWLCHDDSTINIVLESLLLLLLLSWSWVTANLALCPTANLQWKTYHPRNVCWQGGLTRGTHKRAKLVIFVIVVIIVIYVMHLDHTCCWLWTRKGIWAVHRVIPNPVSGNQTG